jgi:hypothetical protein
MPGVSPTNNSGNIAIVMGALLLVGITGVDWIRYANNRVAAPPISGTYPAASGVVTAALPPAVPIRSGVEEQLLVYESPRAPRRKARHRRSKRQIFEAARVAGTDSIEDRLAQER